MGMSAKKSSPNRSTKANVTSNTTVHKIKPKKKPSKRGSLSTLKVTLNEAIKKHLITKYDIVEDNHLLDIKIGFGLAAVLVACLVTWISVREDFNQTYFKQLALIGFYFMLNITYELFNYFYRIDQLVLSGKIKNRDIKVYNDCHKLEEFKHNFIIRIDNKTVLKSPSTIYDYFDANGNLQQSVIE